MTTTPDPKTACPDLLVPYEAQRAYTRATDEGHRARVSGNEADMAAAIRNAKAAEAQFKRCVIPVPHQPPHRAADGTEWGHVEPEPEMVELPPVEVLAAWLTEMEESYENHDAAPEMTMSIDVDIATLADRIADRLRQGA